MTMGKKLFDCIQCMAPSVVTNAKNECMANPVTTPIILPDLA